MKFQGIMSPIITPFKEDGRIDLANFEKHLDHLAAAGIHGVLVFGSLGEFFSVPVEDKKEAIQLAVKTSNHRTKIIVGVGSTKLEETLELAQFSEKAGADVINVVAPYYFPPTEKGVMEHFGRVAEAVDMPIQLYNIPICVGGDLTPEYIAALAARYEHIIGVKDTVDNISHTRRIIDAARKVRPEFSVVSGFDEYYIPNRIAGGDGVLSGLTNVVPELFVKMHNAYEGRDFDIAISCAEKISKLMCLYTVSDSFSLSVKAAVRVQGLPIETWTRTPRLQTLPEEDAKIRKVLEEVLQS
ncbi:dihydrodipicolinate synthase family protein [Selenomonas sp. TAMA-11512]|uniref:4-hydroxy-tetrahydrodipicolinate synthase n=1 Tax=Selenomonas sp. TAMA-11512 TaxID=3095337 RepID=UPI00308B53E9|nr:dihydrodipicolinate synthase family protein [Selenomonas sp. TAMA-11512]